MPQLYYLFPGSFAVIYTLTAAAGILDWMDGHGKGSSSAPQVPFDHSFRALQQNYMQPIMVATFPALAAMDVRSLKRCKSGRLNTRQYI